MPRRPTHNPGRRRRRPRHGGGVSIYAVLAMLGLIAVGSLAVDWARVQAVKTDCQRAADATARGALAIYQAYDASTAQSYAPFIPTSAYNPVDAGSGVQPTVTITWGKWDSTTKTFTAGTYSPPAVKVTVSRTKANGNAVTTSLASVLGFRSVDVVQTSIAAVVTKPAVTYTVSGQSDPWLAGMPAGSTASYNDTAPAQSPQAIPLPAGSTGYLTFTSVTGAVDHGTSGATGPEGKLSQDYTHGADSPGGPTPAAENGIGDITAPIGGLIGVFLDDNAPNTTAAPSTSRDYSTSASRDLNAYTDLQLKQPFYIGDGQTGSGTVQQFTVPAGATRLFLGPMDGHEWSNNTGSFSVTISQSPVIELVK
ncbi:MAG TPA: Tad domain-containing protein [Humisphaera sp.]